MTSEDSGSSARNGYSDLLHGLLADIIGAVRARLKIVPRVFADA